MVIRAANSPEAVLMDILPYIVPLAYLVLLESLTVRWIAGGPVPGLVSRIFATNLAGIALLLFISLTGWFFGWWPDIRNWALRDSFFLFFIIKAPIFGFLFRRWGLQRIFTLHVLSNFASILLLSMLFTYSPRVLAIQPITVDRLDSKARSRLLLIRDAVEEYNVAHGYYPRYIWGGDPVSWRAVAPRSSPDPLLTEGYLQAYPVNPLNLRGAFFEPRREPGWKALWMGYKSIDFLYVRSLWEPIIASDPRFGYRGSKMANILPDPTMPETKLKDDVRFTIQGRWLPGAFFYRSYDLDHNGYPDAYILGVCGDENAQATVDSYDARLDTLTRTIDGQVIPSAFDGIRDGVIYRVFQGFGQARSPHEGQFLPRVAPPGAGNAITRSDGGQTELSAGIGEPAVQKSIVGGENVENSPE
jgi:hypothetical protein